MAAPHLLGLPPVSPELKAILPFLQRAEELQKQDPIVAYWCAYHAAQVGISIKAKDNASRNLLFDLLGVLERMKMEIGPNDAIDVEVASAAYVENFALRVFNMADNEDRKGKATRSTAKKFLAAANFLEVLKVFPKTEITESNEEKARYAKWKAVDIAKAFREGRKPTPGPADSEAPPTHALSAEEPTVISPPPPLTSHATTSSTQTHSTNSSVPEGHPGSASSYTSPGSSPRFKPNSPQLKRISPPPQMDPADIARANLLHTPPKSFDALGPAFEINATPGSWSTTATPGTTDVFEDEDDETRARQRSIDKGKGREGAGPVLDDSPSHRGHKQMADESEPELGLDDARKVVHFSPSVTGSSPMTQSPTIHNTIRDSGVDFGVGAGSPASRGVIPPPPPPFQTPSEPVSPTLYRQPQGSPPVPPPLFSPLVASPPSPSQLHSIPNLASPVAPPVVTSVQASVPTPIELTPSLIGKVQKHCRFAISSLDYEDAEQARRELRAALALLGE